MLPIDKFTIIQNALSMTGNNVPSSADDGQDEWETANRAFDRAIGILVSRHDWKFATKTALLTSLLSSSPSPKYARAFEKPADCLHVISIYAPLPTTPNANFQTAENAYAITAYEMVADKLCTNYPDPLTLKYLVIPEPEATHPLFVEALTLYVEAGCLRGLNEDYGEALSREKQAEMMLGEAKARTDMQQPRRNMRHSALLQSRRRRRPC